MAPRGEIFPGDEVLNSHETFAEFVAKCKANLRPDRHFDFWIRSKGDLRICILFEIGIDFSLHMADF